LRICFKARHDKPYAEYLTLKKSSGFGAAKKAQKALDAANAYYDAHRAEITLCEAAKRYLKDVLQIIIPPNPLWI
jgi:hypothetical protein